jgi:HAE1 family hydrophobic/amphiphilic exporter-1
MAFVSGEGSETWAPMARAVIGGMTLSTLLTLVVVPVIYVMMAGWIDRRKAKKRALRERKESPSQDQQPELPIAAASAIGK